MEIRVGSIKRVEEDLKQLSTNNVKVIIVSSYDKDIESINNQDKLVLHFDDITYKSDSSFDMSIARKIHSFIDNIDFNKYKLYVCCDSGESRSSAIAASILRKYNEDENIIWKDYNYHPNILVYEIMCKEFGLKNSSLRLKYKKYINDKTLKNKIKKNR